MEKSNTEEIVAIIRKNAKKIGYDYDALSDKDKQYLMIIETVITETFELEQKAKEMISKNVVSVKGISKKTDIARQTLYNNSMLKEYINYRSMAFEKIDASKNDTAKDDEIKRLKEEITALHIRDVELEEAKRVIKELRKELKDRDEAIKALKQSSNNNLLTYHSNNHSNLLN